MGSEMCIRDRTYTVTDDCETTATCVQTITIENELPQLVCVATVTEVECEADILPNVTTPTIIGPCGETIDLIVSGPTLTSGDATCFGASYIVTFSATDDCGRSTSCDQAFSLINAGPMITCPSDQVVACLDEVIAGTPDFTTSCDLTAGFEASGAVGALHHHPHVQSTYVESGRFRFTLGDEEREVSAGDCFVVPSGMEHGCVCIEPGKMIDSFTPRREDFL